MLTGERRGKLAREDGNVRGSAGFRRGEDITPNSNPELEKNISCESAFWTNSAPLYLKKSNATGA